MLSNCNISGNTNIAGTLSVSGNTTILGNTTIISTINISGIAQFNTGSCNDNLILWSKFRLHMFFFKMNIARNSSKYAIESSDNPSRKYSGVLIDNKIK